jgi:hypothetical protein
VRSPEPAQCLGSPAARALGALEGLLGPATQGLIELFADPGEVVLAGGSGSRRRVDLDLLLVEDVLADTLSQLGLIELCLVGVLAILTEPDLGASRRIERTGSERCLGGVKRFLIAIEPGLLAVSDPLVEIDLGLFPVHAALQFALLANVPLGHVLTSAGRSLVASAAGRPMWKPCT